MNIKGTSSKVVAKKTQDNELNLDIPRLQRFTEVERYKYKKPYLNFYLKLKLDDYHLEK